MDSNKIDIIDTTEISTPIGIKYTKKQSLRVTSLRPSRSLRKMKIIPKSPIQSLIKKNLFDKTINDRK